MKKKTALVLSGGGAKGAFQLAAEKFLREERGYQWDVIAGVSVGALNGVMLAMHKYAQLEAIWKNISNERVYTGKLNGWTLAKLVVKKMLGLQVKSLLGNEPLRNLLNREVDLQKIKVDLKIGAVSLETGEYHNDFIAQPNLTNAEFQRAILASTAIPIIWEPVEISAGLKHMVDGGVRNVSPLGDVLDENPDEVVIINCNPFAPVALKRPPHDVLDIAKRTLDIAMNEIFVTDVREFLRINEMVDQARAKRVTLYKQDGKPYKYFDFTIIQPDQSLDDTLDFSQEAIARSMAAGRKKAEQVTALRLAA
jgi:NTE family protein